MDTIKATLTKSRSIYIKAVDEQASLDNELFAINWFNTKISWMYTLYGLLAGGILIKAGGRPRFKGKVTKTIMGNVENSRDTLLIVSYPSGMAFKSLVEKTYFKIISIFRIKSVDKFSFGFSFKDSITPEKPTRNIKLSYAVHHFKNGDHVFEMLKNPDLRDPVQVIYAGKIAALLHAGDDEKIKVQVPCVMDGLVVFAAENDLTLTSFFESEAYQSVVEKTDSSFIGMLKRAF